VREEFEKVKNKAELYVYGDFKPAKRPRLDADDVIYTPTHSSFASGDLVVVNFSKDGSGPKTLANVLDKPQSNDMQWLSAVTGTNGTGSYFFAPINKLIKTKYKSGDQVPLKFGSKTLADTFAEVVAVRLTDGKIMYEMKLNRTTYLAEQDKLV
jgi:hypothetical protein